MENTIESAKAFWAKVQEDFSKDHTVAFLDHPASYVAYAAQFQAAPQRIGEEEIEAAAKDYIEPYWQAREAKRQAFGDGAKWALSRQPGIVLPDEEEKHNYDVDQAFEFMNDQNP